MPRKSRKNADATAPLAVKRNIFDVGAYVRLSAEDRKHKGDSIETQQSIISAYIAEHPDLELRETYIDNGLSGQSFERPAFLRMLEDLENGKINCCVTKDLSRLGRNAIDTGYYIEKHFPTHGIRYIAVNDDYDSADGNSGGIMVSLKNMINEAFALEIGRKIRTTKQMNIRNGCFVGRIPPYGYLKSQADGHKLVPDEYASVIVRRMFEMAASGHSVREILDWINGEEIPTPRRYFHSLGLATEKEIKGHIHWNKGGVYSILHNRVYCGDMIQGKGKTRSYVLERIPQSDWVITENTHEGIVSHELFAEVQKLWDKPGGKTSSKYSNPSTENIFLRKVFCGHCGYAMRRTRTGETQYNIKCDTRFYYSHDDCTLVSINENDLKEKLLESLREKSHLFAKYQSFEEVTAKADNSGKIELQNIQTELDRNNRLLKGLYESLVCGDITNTEYKDLKDSYQAKIASLTERGKKLWNDERNKNQLKLERSKAVNDLQSVQSTADLSAALINKLVDKILVYEGKRVEIQFKFSNETEGAA